MKVFVWESSNSRDFAGGEWEGFGVKSVFFGGFCEKVIRKVCVGD